MNQNQSHEEGSGRFQTSFAGRVYLAFAAVLVLMAAIAAVCNAILDDPWLVFLIVLLIGLPIGAVLVAGILRPLDITLSGLRDGISSFRDRDFSLRLASGRNDEMGELARLYNDVGSLLQEERHNIRQKELVLETALDRSPVAIMLVNQLGRVIFSNPEARKLLFGGAKLEGRSFAEIEEGCPEDMREILAGEGEGIFSVKRDDVVETYHLSHRQFLLNRQRHSLVLLHRLTGELGRQEAAIWKKVIRVISHELNNSLAPISSLVHSAKLIRERPDLSYKSEEIFTTIEERLEHIAQFIEGYAKFARLPEPRKSEVDWLNLLTNLSDFPSLTIEEPLPSRPGFGDTAQLRQLLINLVKNAVEASETEPRVSIRVRDAGNGTYLHISDRGPGMDEETMKKALLPFYSTKKTGTGLGLALSREIVEGHGGTISLQSRPGGGTIVTCWLPAL
jgi:nitrogen fixation/metabolism regulation signal transduction histidine kinase